MPCTLKPIVPSYYSDVCCGVAMACVAIVCLSLVCPGSIHAFSSVTTNVAFSRRHGRQFSRLLISAQERKPSMDRLSRSAPLDYMDEEQGNVHFPASGISVSDEIEFSQKDRFFTDVVPVRDLPGVAQLVTSPTVMGSFEPVRYLVALSPPLTDFESGDGSPIASFERKQTDFAMVDIPPFSMDLSTRIQTYLSEFDGRLRMTLVTNRDAIHYDESPAVYSTRRADLEMWLAAFPGLIIVAYRLDIPRDCRHAVSQVLDGYGPFALEENPSISHGNLTFVETGRPLSYSEWNVDVAEQVLSGTVPADEVLETASDSDDDNFTPIAIRQREEKRRVLAVYSPGYTFGSISYVFPESGVCCTGFTIPVEESRSEENQGIGTPGPAIDCRGYISSSKGRSRQMESAKVFVNAYSDRFKVVLPCRGDPLFLDSNDDTRRIFLLDTIAQYEKISDIYERLGILSDDFEED